MEDFSLKFSREENGDYVIFIYDGEREFYAMVQGTDFTNVLKHALHYADPLLAANLLGDSFIDWVGEHNAIELRK